LLRTGNEEFNFKAGQFILDIDSSINILSVQLLETMIPEDIIYAVAGNQIRLILKVREGGNFVISNQYPGVRVAKFLMIHNSEYQHIPPVAWVNHPRSPATILGALVNNVIEVITTPETHFIDFGTNVGPINSTLLEDYKLSQNYPNPFNPLTVITYYIPKQNFVKVNVSDELGREVKLLVSEVKNKGSYSAEFNGDGLASGIYYYSIEAGDFKQTKKMILVK
jgi:hypothetical protein